MTEEYVTAKDRGDGVFVVEFTTPKANSLGAEILDKLVQSISAAGQAKDVRVVLLQSVGKSFCAGASLGELEALKSIPEAEEFFFRFGKLILALRDCPKIVVTRVHGNAVGGGVGIVAASDYTVASEEASIKLSELSRGIGPFVVSSVIERKIGLGNFSALALDTEWRSAAWAAERGLYSHLAPPNELDGHVAAALKHFAGLSLPAALELKRLFWAGTESWPELLRARAKLSATYLLLSK